MHLNQKKTETLKWLLLRKWALIFTEMPPTFWKSHCLFDICCSNIQDYWFIWSLVNLVSTTTTPTTATTTLTKDDHVEHLVAGFNCRTFWPSIWCFENNPKTNSQQKMFFVISCFCYYLVTETDTPEKDVTVYNEKNEGFCDQNGLCNCILSND